MANNTTLNPGTGGDVIRDLDRTGVKTQVVGLDVNPAGAEILATGDANGLNTNVKTAPGQAANAAAGLPAVLGVVAGYDGTNVRAITTNAAGNAQVGLAAALPAGGNIIGKVDVNTLPTQGGALNGTMPANVQVIGGSDGTNSQTIKTNSSGLLQVQQSGALPAGANTLGKVDQGLGGGSAWAVTGPLTDAQLRASVVPVIQDRQNRPTYGASAAITVGATATDVFTIGGAVSKTIFVTKVTLSSTQTTVGENQITLLKRSTANTGGTSGGVPAVPYDSASAAAAASLLAYTANPTTGTLVGPVMRNATPGPQTASATAAITTYLFETPIVLRGVAELFAVNLNGVTAAGLSLNVSVEWYEV